MSSFYPPRDAYKLTGLTRKQVTHWDRSGFIQASYRSRKNHRLYTFPDLVLLRLAKFLRTRNYSVQRLRKLIPTVRELQSRAEFPLSEGCILIEDNGVLYCNGDVWMNLAAEESTHVFSVPEFASYVEEQKRPSEDLR